MISVTEDNFESVVRQSKLPVLGFSRGKLFWHHWGRRLWLGRNNRKEKNRKTFSGKVWGRFHTPTGPHALTGLFLCGTPKLSVEPDPKKSPGAKN